ncbi:hypothetical protein COCON_G00208800 [Conger conger]|uniref:Casein kinase substrate phosphoprotein PP28 domain-containing protein n=1 Tax=Conger conger TaxID=82655 RepID=A0A9Q1D0P8_CONCO|nr:hypothetical protein COCON_G00208800 [Conger conger]
MPKGGRKGGHKGRMRTYTSPEEIDAQMKAEKERKKQEEEEGAALNDCQVEEKLRRPSPTPKTAMRTGLRREKKTKKVTELELEGPQPLSRREREEIEKQKAKERYMKMHLAGKTDQAKADLARLAIIKKQREDAARKKEEERKAKEAAAAAAKGLHTLSLK